MKMMCILGVLFYIWYIFIRLVCIIGVGVFLNLMVDFFRWRFMIFFAFESVDSIIEDFFYVGYFCFLIFVLIYLVFISGVLLFGWFLKFVMRVVCGVYFMYMLVFVSRFSWFCGYISIFLTFSLFFYIMGWIYVWF